DEAARAYQRHVSEESDRDPGERWKMKRMFATLCRIVGRRAAPAAGERFIGQPAAEQDKACADHAWNEVRADAGIAAIRRQHGGAGGHADAQGKHAERKSALRPRACLHVAIS